VVRDQLSGFREEDKALRTWSLNNDRESITLPRFDPPPSPSLEGRGVKSAALRYPFSGVVSPVILTLIRKVL
jgi:hypothetical protein